MLYSAFLHTHYRGLAGSLELVKPDGTRQMLINLPRYDFNWQRTYDFVEPVKIPAGSKLVSTYVYDNSVRNAANPDPDATVFWGDQSWEEMHYTSFYYQWADETVANMPAGKQSDANAPFRAYRIMGMLDDNLDEKVQLAETKGTVREVLAPKFAEFDKNKDGGLDNAELVPARPACSCRSSGRTRPSRSRGPASPRPIVTTRSVVECRHSCRSVRSAATKASGWSSITWWRASGMTMNGTCRFSRSRMYSSTSSSQSADLSPFIRAMRQRVAFSRS